MSDDDYEMFADFITNTTATPVSCGPSRGVKRGLGAEVGVNAGRTMLQNRPAYANETELDVLDKRWFTIHVVALGQAVTLAAHRQHITRVVGIGLNLAA